MPNLINNTLTSITTIRDKAVKKIEINNFIYCKKINIFFDFISVKYSKKYLLKKKFTKNSWNHF